MSELYLSIEAIDTLMFRDGRPFNQMDAGASVAVSVFPPYPPTVVGAVRAMLWQEKLDGKWDSTKLGDGTNWQKVENTLGPLKFGAPIIVRKQEDKETCAPVFPLPLHIVKSQIDGKEKLTRLSPGPERECEFGLRRLPVPDELVEGIKPIENRWVSSEGMSKILNGGVPDKNDLIERDKLWQKEPRVGIGIEHATRITNEGQLYMANHVRLSQNTALYVQVSGWTDEVHEVPASSLRPLAGEHRMVEIKNDKKIPLPQNTIKFNDGCWCAIALSPVVPDSDFNIAGLPTSNIVSACLGKPVPVGGWNSTTKPVGPIPLRQCYPTGSVWFMKGNTDNLPEAIGLAQNWGFGKILIGIW